MRKCSILGCERKHKGYGFCGLHYKRIKAGKDLLTPVQQHIKGVVAKRLSFYSKEEPCVMPDIEGNCIVWIGKRTHLGYGKVSVNSKWKLAHRVAWEEVFGKMHPENVLDHLCENKACINIEHLRFCQNAKHHLLRHQKERDSNGRFLKAS